MKKTLFFFFLLLCSKISASAYEAEFPYHTTNLWSSENMQRIKNIKYLIYEYREEARKRWLVELNPNGEKWDAEYRRQIRQLNSLTTYSLRYPDVCHDILLFDQRLDVMKNYRDEEIYHLYMRPGWAYSLEEKIQKIAKEREIIKQKVIFCKEVLFNCRDKLTHAFIEVFEELLQRKQQTLLLYHDYGLLAFNNNNFDKSYEMLFALMDEAQKTDQLEQLDEKVYHDLGSVCVEVMAYDKAIRYLSEAIRQDPSNKETYFNRSIAYFETGQFDLAIDDYLLSDKVSSYYPDPSHDFTQALCASLCQGAAESALDFVPSLCSSTYGMGKALWATAQTPVESTKAFSSACYEIGQCFVDYCRTVDANTIDGHVDQLKKLYYQFDQLSDSEKGELIGFTIGKYGVEFLASGFVIGGAIKGGKAIANGVSAYRHLKNANRACNLEAMAASSLNKEKIIAESLKHAAERETYCKNVKIHWDRQNKHIPGKHNFVNGGGVIEIESSELEVLLKNNVGKGQKVTGNFSEAGYRERVDFGIIIGKYAKQIDGQPTQYLSTSKGIIVHAKDGNIHVWPSEP